MDRMASASRAGDKTSQVKEAALTFGADVVGIAPVERWNDHVPEGHRPADLLPGAKSVVVVGARGPTAGAWRSPHPRVMEVLGLDFANDRAIAALTGWIEANLKCEAIQAPGLSVSGHMPPFSYMLAAVLAGLGTRSFAANIVLNPKIWSALLFRLHHDAGAGTRCNA